MDEINISELTLLSKPYDGDPSKDRDKFVGGSDAGAILGVNPWKSAYTLWAEKTGLIETPDISDKAAVWWGTMEEDIVAKRFEILENKKVRRSNKTYYINEFPFICAHVDRMVVGEKAGLECKTMTARNNIDLESGEVPAQYYAQCQFYMLCTGLLIWYIAIKRDNAELYVIRIERDEEYIQSMLQAVIEFWKHVLDKTPPEIDGSYSTQQTINAMYPAEDAADTKDNPVYITSDITEMLESMKMLDESIHALETQKEALISTIKDWMKDNTYAQGERYKLRWNVVRGRKSIDTKRLQAEMPEVYEKYLKQGSDYRTFKYEEVKV